MNETPEQIYSRLNGEPAPAQQAPQESTPADHQDNEDVAMKEAREDVETYRRLHQLAQEPSDRTSLFPGAHPGEAIADNVKKMGEGLIAGAGLRKGLRGISPDFLYNPELPEIQKKLIPQAEREAGQYHDLVMDELERKNALREQHLQEGRALRDEASMHRSALNQTERDLADARRQHLNSQALEPEHFLPPEYSLVPEHEPVPERVGLTTKPLGGTATEKYALSYGATPEEARLVASPSEMQKKNIPFQQGAFERLRSVGEPNVVLSEESPLALNPEAQKAVEERKAEQMRLEAKAKADADFKAAQRQAAAKQVAQAKLEAEQRVKALEQQRKEQLERATQAEKEYRSHMQKVPSTPEPTPAERSTYQKLANEMEDLQDKVYQQIGRYGDKYGKAGQILAKIGTKIAPRFVPYYGSAMAIPQAEAAKQEFERGNKIKGGLYALGSAGAAMQATTNPLLMGAGDIMQIPAAGLGIYDIMSEKPRD